MYGKCSYGKKEISNGKLASPLRFHFRVIVKEKKNVHRETVNWQKERNY